MKLLFKKIHIHNFMSIEDEQIDLDLPGFVLVKGINNNSKDNANSNGSGKSAIFESIVWCLTGQTIRGNKDIVNHQFKKDAFVEIILENSYDVFKITRYKDHSEYKNNLTIFVNNENKSGKGLRSSEEILQKLLPDLDIDLLGSVVVLGQGLPQRFTLNTPSGRKEILEKLSKSDFMIEDIKERVSKRKEVLTNEINSLDKEYTIQETLLESNKNKLLECNKDIESLEKLSIDKLEEEKSKYSDNILDLKNKIESISTEKNNINKALEEAREKYTIISSKYNESELNTKNKYNDLINSCVIEKGKLESEKKINKKELNKLKSISDICPTCGQKILGVVKPDTSDLESTINLNIVNIYAQEIRIDNFKLELENELSKINISRKSELGEIEEEGRKTKEKLNNIAKDIENLEVELRDANIELQSINNKIDFYKTNKNKITLQIESLKKDIEKQTEKILYIYNKRDKANSYLQIINKINSLISRDFRGFLLSNIINYLNNKSHRYSQIILNNSEIRFELDGNNLNIYYDNRQYESLSGGEKQRIDLIIQFILRNLLEDIRNFSSNLIIIDECFDGLDRVGCDSIIDFISKLESIETIFIVTHNDSLNIPCDNTIIIEKDSKGVSHIIK